MKTVLLIVSFYIMTSCHAMAGNMHFFHISSKDGLPHQNGGGRYLYGAFGAV